MPSLPDEIKPPLYDAVGRVVVSWAYVEFALDSWTAAIYQAAGGRHLEAQLPQALKRKLKFLHRCFGRIAALKPYAKEARNFMRRAERLSQIRHFVVHGVPMDYDHDTHSLLFAKMDMNKDKTWHHISDLKTSVAQLADDGAECAEMALSMMEFAQRLVKAFVP